MTQDLFPQMFKFLLQIPLCFFQGMHLPKDREGEATYSGKTEDPVSPKGWPGIRRLSRDASVVLKEKAAEASGSCSTILAWRH